MTDGLPEGGSGDSLSAMRFMKKPGQTLPRAMILSYVWGSAWEGEDGNLDNYVYFLRRRLKALNASAKLVTVHGVGYRLEGM